MKDTRDLRDPQELGEELDYRRSTAPKKRLSLLADYVELHSKIRNYPQDESLATSTAREYKEELEERAKAGDRYAQSMLSGESWDEPVIQ